MIRFCSLPQKLQIWYSEGTLAGFFAAFFAFLVGARLVFFTFTARFVNFLALDFFLDFFALRAMCCFSDYGRDSSPSGQDGSALPGTRQ